MQMDTVNYCSKCGHRYSDAAVSRQLDLSARPAAEFHQAHRGATLDLRTPKPLPHVEPKPKQPAAAPATTAAQRQAAASASRLEAAKATPRSPHIERFPRAKPAPSSSEQPQSAPATPAMRTSPASVVVAPIATPARTLPNQAVTQHEGLKALAKPTRPSKPRYQFLPQPARVLTVMAAIFIMGSYIWLQNSPKLALQSANNQAGITASLPGYLPSSYSLGNTNTGPGHVSLSFKSPSIPEILKINQHRTTWDSASLLDNFVAKQADDYSTIHGQGLTIYVFGQNQAAWVNHGIWYNIEGATRLSREQLLKIAFSL